MATKKITQLPAAAAAALTQLLEIVNDPSGTPVSQKLTLQQLLTLIREPDFTTTDFDLPTGQVTFAFLHGLAAAPRLVVAVGINQPGSGGGYGLNVAVPLASFVNTADFTSPQAWADATSVHLSLSQEWPGNYLGAAAAGSSWSPDFSDLKGRIYCWK